jgi:hypothetical protein
MIRFQHQETSETKKTGELEIIKEHFIDPINRLAYKSELVS